MHKSTYSTVFQHAQSWLFCSLFGAVATCSFWLCCSVMAADEEESQPEEFFNPLEVTTPDPLLPSSTVKQPLSTLERLKLASALEQLNQQAAARLADGDRVGAFDIWNRELRLRRSLGLQEEIKALSRVGAIAWNENQSTEVKIITKRLQTIQQQQQTQIVPDLNLLRSLGSAFEQVRAFEPAVAAYEQVLLAARQRKDNVEIEATLKIIAELNLSWFDYGKAATAYKELLNFTKVNQNSGDELTYLQQLAYVYDQAKQVKEAVAIKQKIAEFYLSENYLAQLPALRLDIASDYESLGQIQKAFQNYQEAYATAWSLQQFARASDALRRLVALYRTQNLTDAALKTSQILLDSDQLASNSYGLMDTYKQLGQIYVQQGNYPEALSAFQKGLELAQQLDYQEKYFATQIENVTKKIAN